jgi:hypothetical protein
MNNQIIFAHWDDFDSDPVSRRIAIMVEHYFPGTPARPLSHPLSCNDDCGDAEEIAYHIIDTATGAIIEPDKYLDGFCKNEIRRSCR